MGVGSMTGENPLSSHVSDGLDDGFEAFYAVEYDAAVAAAKALCGSWTVAEELVQDAFVATFQRWRTVKDMAHRQAWFRRVLLNRATSHLRRVSTERRANARHDQPTDGTEVPANEQDSLWAAVRRLPKQQRKAIVLRYVYDLSRAEVAEAMRCSEETVKTHLARAHRTIEKQLDRAKEQR